MQRRLGILLVVCSSFVVAGTARAEDRFPSGPVSLPGPRDIVVDVGPHEATLVAPEEYLKHGSKILFINRCEGGETISRGFNDSRTNRSSIVPSTINFPAYPYGEASWQQVMQDVRDIMAPYDVAVTDIDPGSVSHFEIIACGTSFRGENVLGVAPSGCSVVENAIGFAFAEEHGDSPRDLAETIAHEAAHTWTMPHLYDCEDPMTYLGGCGNKYFQDTDLSCAGLDGNDWVKTSCGCGGSTRNSHEVLLSVFGPSEPTPPAVEILEPVAGATVQGGFVVRPEISDEQGVASASLYVDGSLVLTLTQSPFVFNGPAELTDGSHTVEVRASDRLGATGSASITVVRGDPPPGGTPGALGGTCAGNQDCFSGMCASSGDVQICTQPCDSDCPAGFACLAAGDSNVCWPSESGEGGGCSTGGGGGEGPLALVGLALMLGFVRRSAVRG
jgi:hypothetical protein